MLDHDHAVSDDVRFVQLTTDPPVPGEAVDGRSFDSGSPTTKEFLACQTRPTPPTSR